MLIAIGTDSPLSGSTRWILFMVSIIAIALGGAIYLLFRPDHLIMFDWVGAVGMEEPLDLLRSSTLPLLSRVPDWILYSLPNGLWTLSFTCLIFSIWGTIDERTIAWGSIIPLSGSILEFGQFYAAIPGTFDPMDIAMYLIGGALPLFFQERLSKRSTHE